MPNNNSAYIYSKENESSHAARQSVRSILDTVYPWEEIYSPEFLDWVRSNYNPREFFWTCIYRNLTPEEQSNHDRVSPIKLKDCQLEIQIPQHLTQETLDRLSTLVIAVHTLGILATSKQDFETRYCRRFGLNQLELSLDS